MRGLIKNVITQISLFALSYFTLYCSNSYVTSVVFSIEKNYVLCVFAIKDVLQAVHLLFVFIRVRVSHGSRSNNCRGDRWRLMNSGPPD